MKTGTITATGTVSLYEADLDHVSAWAIQFVSASFSGSVTIKGAVVASGATATAIAYKNVATGVMSTSAITGSAIIIVPADGLLVTLDATVSSGSLAYSAKPVVGAVGAPLSSLTATLSAGELHLGQVGTSYFSDSDTFARPADTTAYAANDRLSATTSDTAATPLRSFTAARVAGGKGILTSCLVSSNLTPFLPRLRIHLYTVAAPTTAIAGDNAAFAHYYANEGSYVGRFDMPALALPGGAGTDMVRAFRDDLWLPFDCAAADAEVYYAIEILDAATPASAQSITLEFGGIQG